MADNVFIYKATTFYTQEGENDVLLINKTNGKAISINTEEIGHCPIAEDCLHTIVATYWWFHDMYADLEADIKHPVFEEVSDFLGDVSVSELKEYFNDYTNQEIIEFP